MKIVKLLPHQFRGTGEVKGYSFTKIDESEKAFIYEKVSTTGKKSYEVFEKRVNRRFLSQRYPKSHDFGVWAWECSSFDSAFKKFNELSN
ncbi:hypothetical protein ACTS94_08820 [Empedobacter falsenii]